MTSSLSDKPIYSSQLHLLVSHSLPLELRLSILLSICTTVVCH